MAKSSVTQTIDQRGHMGYGATKVENVSQCQQLSVQPAGLGPPQRLSICRLADIKDQGESQCAAYTVFKTQSPYLLVVRVEKIAVSP